jgi:hypothetical protein
MLPQLAPMAPEMAAVVRRMRAERMLTNSKGEVKSFL